MTDILIVPATDNPVGVDEALQQIVVDFADADMAGPDDFDVVALPATEPAPLGRGWAYDWSARRFVRTTQGAGILATQGEATLREWVAKAMHTQRGAHPVHSEDYGMDDPFVLIGLPAHAAPVGAYQDDLRRALTFHPRIADVRGFKTSTDEATGEVALSFTVVLDDDSAINFDPFALG